jgi:putative DNA primase/helicase
MATAKPVEQDGKRRLVRAKSNIGPDGGGYEYDLILEPLVGFDFAAQRVAWGDPLDGTARELLNDVEQVDDGAADGKLGEAESLLREMLGAGPVAHGDIKRAASANGVAEVTLRRAKATLGIAAVKNGMKGGWRWKLPDTPPKPAHRRRSSNPEDAQQNRMSIFGENDHLRETEWEGEI